MLRWLGREVSRGVDVGPPGSPEWWDWWVGAFGPLLLFGVEVRVESFAGEPERDWDAALRDLTEL